MKIDNGAHGTHYVIPAVIRLNPQKTLRVDGLRRLTQNFTPAFRKLLQIISDLEFFHIGLPCSQKILGWLVVSTHLKNMKVRWDDYCIPNIWKYKSHVPVTTNHCIYIYILSIHHPYIIHILTKYYPYINHILSIYIYISI